jgi:ribosomal protein L37AE/L43A
MVIDESLVEVTFCPLCKKQMVRKEMKNNVKNFYWQCKDCKITVEITYALIDI